MSTSTVSWDLIASFLAVMEHGSLSAAARALGASQPTVRRQIETLEQAIGAVLFTRSNSGLVPTGAALLTLPMAREMAANAAAFARAASGAAGQVTGAVRIACSEVLGSEVLPPILARLMQAYPLIEIELVADDRDEDVLRGDVDVAVRMHRPTQIGLVARKLADIDIGLFASEAYLATRATPITVADLSGHIMIGEDRRMAIATALRTTGMPVERGTFRFRSDGSLVQLGAIRAGIGIGVCQVRLASQHALRRILPDHGAALDVWVAMHDDQRSTPRVKAVFDHLAHDITAFYRSG